MESAYKNLFTHSVFIYVTFVIIMSNDDFFETK